MNYFTAKLAWRYAKGFKTNRFLSYMVLICILALCISSFSMALIMAIMNGLEEVTYQQLKTIHPSLIMRSYGEQLDERKITKILVKEYTEIDSFSPVGIAFTLINSANVSYTAAVIKGINPQSEATKNIQKHTISNLMKPAPFSNLLHPHGIILGEQLAKNLKVKIGDYVAVLTTDPEEETVHTLTLDKQTLCVTGLLKTGIDEFDSSLAYISLSLFKDLFPHRGVTQIDMQLKSSCDIQKIVKKLTKRFHIPVYSWQDLYPSLVSALMLEWYAFLIVLTLIVLLASINIIALICMYAMHKKRDIAILQILGYTKKNVRLLFFYLGMGISFLSTMIGLTCATGVAYLIDAYKMISLPTDNYYVSHLPAKMTPPILILVFVIVMSIGFLATIIASRHTTHANMIKNLQSK